MFQKLHIDKDGSSYTIEATIHDGGTFYAVLRENWDGWDLTNMAIGMSHNIGLRKDWVVALADALRWMEANMPEVVKQAAKTRGAA